MACLLRQILLGLLLCTLLLLNSGHAAAAEPGGTSIYLQLFPDASGRLDMVLVKNYSGAPSPFQDVINLPGQDWYLFGPPLVDTAGAVTVDSSKGAIRVQGTGRGQVTIRYSTRIYSGMNRWESRYRTSFLLHSAAFSDLGPTKVTIQATLPPGVITNWKQSGLSVDDLTQPRPLIVERTFRNDWQAHATVEPNHFASAELAFAVPHNATPGWLSIAGFTLAGGAFALMLYDFYRQKQTPTGLS